MLLDIVDPFSYRDKLTMPKLIMNSTGDQFFLPDSSRFYLSQMPGENHLHYVPNSDHGLNSDSLTMNTILSFYASFLFDLGRPQFTWTFEGANTIRVRPETPPKEAWLWQAYSDPAVTDPHGPVGRRDFRLDAIGAAWTKTALPEQGNGDFIGQVTVPSQGWRAFFVQLVYEESTAQITYAYTTSVRVVPDTYPQFESYRTSVGIGADEIPVCVLYGQEGGQSAYQLGVDYGTLMRAEIQAFVPQFLAGVQASEPAVYSNGALDAAWATTSPYADARYLDEMEGLAAGAQVPIETIRRAHMVPVLGSFSCSFVAAWGEATASGRLLQTRDLDWDLEAGAHEFPCLTMYIPQESDGVPHVNVGFAGLIGCQTGMNLGGIVVSEMGDSPEADRPFDLNGNHFMPMLREVLYDSLNLSEAIAKIYDTQRIKKYHYVIGDGRNYEAAVKIKAHEPDPMVVYTDNDQNDPNAPDGIFTDAVYNDEGRGAATFIDTYYGALDYLRMAEIANALAIHGSNVLYVVYDATGGEEAGKIALPLWVSYAQGAQEAYMRAPEDYVRFDMQAYLP
jgi:hypothetical protein